MIKKFTPFIILAILAAEPVFAQDSDTTYWKRSFKTGISLNQAAFSSNWSAGGINSIGLNTLLNFRADYRRDRHSWDNQVDFLYGFVNNAGQGYRKTNDRLFLDTKYGYALSSKWDMFTSLTFLSQFARGYRFENDADGVEQAIRISNFMTPGFLTLAWGFEYKPADFFRVRFSPFAPRLTFAFDETALANVPTRYGVDPGKNVRTEWLAAQIMADFNKDLTETINLKWRYIMFAGYDNFSFETIDHRLDAMLTAKLVKYLDVSLNFIMLYDKDQADGIQYNQSLGIGFVYSIQNFQE